MFYRRSLVSPLGIRYNTQNTRVWSVENPYEFKEKPLHDQKVGVWYAISRKRIIGPIFFSETINSERYRAQILQPFISKLSQRQNQGRMVPAG